MYSRKTLKKSQMHVDLKYVFKKRKTIFEDILIKIFHGQRFNILFKIQAGSKANFYKY